MNIELFDFQKQAVEDLHWETIAALDEYSKRGKQQIISFTAPTGAGKTIVLTSFFECLFFGSDTIDGRPKAVVLWVSDSPTLNVQSKCKIETKSNKVRNACEIIDFASFDKEFLEDGHIYFINTQKLSAVGKLGLEAENRQYTIWETLRNTIREKADRFVVVIDEAHRGALDKNKEKENDQLPIMQKFVKGSLGNNLPAMPLVIGMTATPERFNKLVEKVKSNVRTVTVDPVDVRESGLLKDRIVVCYPENEGEHNMSVFQVAIEDWKDKCKHWHEYCEHEGHTQVNPVFIVQVENETANSITATPLAECLEQLQAQLGRQFTAGEVVHTFGNKEALTFKNYIIKYVDPSSINDDARIKVVFFKKNLSTGWDCPRAESMMSFRKAEDKTDITQLLGRVIRTPLQRSIPTDDVLNEVRLFLPHFNKEKVNEIVEMLQRDEAGRFANVISAPSTMKTAVNYGYNHTIPSVKANQPIAQGNVAKLANSASEIDKLSEITSNYYGTTQIVDTTNYDNFELEGDVVSVISESHNDSYTTLPKEKSESEKIFDFINDLQIKTTIQKRRTLKSPLKSWIEFATFISSNLQIINGARDVLNECLQKASKVIANFVKKQKDLGRYQTIIENIRNFQMSTRSFEMLGDISKAEQQTLFVTATSRDIEHQFKIARRLLSSDNGITTCYANTYSTEEYYQIDVIAFVRDNSWMDKLNSLAKDEFNNLYERFKTYLSLKYLKSQERMAEARIIINSAECVNKIDWEIEPEIIKLGSIDSQGDFYELENHLVADENGKVRVKFDSQLEYRVLLEEMQRPDFVCWLRNLKPWGLRLECIDDSGLRSGFFPDFIIIRRNNDNEGSYKLDILEPHNQNLGDVVKKAKALAAFAKDHPWFDRVQIIHEYTNSEGEKGFYRLDTAKLNVRNALSTVVNDSQYKTIFESLAKIEKQQ